MAGNGTSDLLRRADHAAARGTFIYHTHLHDYRQLSSGLYGPLIVTEPGITYDAAVDHVIVLSSSRTILE